jgi:hypothetical protein
VSQSDALAEAMDAIAVIRDETLDCIDALKKQASGEPVLVDEADKAKLIARLHTYAARLKSVAEAGPAGLKKQFTVAKKLLLNSFDAQLCAVIRAHFKCKSKATLAELIVRAKELTVWQPLAEAVTVIWVEKPKGGYRPIVMYGPMRTAQCLMVRDILSVMGIDSDFDFTRKGAGGELQLVKNVCNDIEEGTHWWWTPDIKNCFASIKPGHFGWLPIDRRLLKNVMFLPKCAKIVVAKHEDPGLVLQSLHAHNPDLTVDDALSALHHLTVQIIRQGLPQGSVLSPLLARAFIRRAIETALPDPEVSRYAHSDDLNVGAHTKGKLLAAKQVVTELFSSLPAGQIELHDGPVVNAFSRRVEVLGYRLEPGNGHGDNLVHVKPARKRTERFKRKLTKKLQEAEPGADHFAIAEKYRVQWSNSQPAWTKVPFYSNEVSSLITMTYVDDFLHGLPMGVCKVNKPKVKYVGNEPSPSA